ncbi:MAG: aminoglycoside phosphotransferase family protein [Deinococcus sp.]|nr:aminoglycoside phosphotransferase family protein [Deinococcus sp.]
MNALRHYLPQVRQYLQQQREIWPALGLCPTIRFQLTPIPGGAINLNYHLQVWGRHFVVRLNTVSQIGLDPAAQIRYEYCTLQFLKSTSLTPRPRYLDDTLQILPLGLLIEDYLPGRPLNYRRDLAAAARTLAIIHRLPVAKRHPFIVQDRPLQALFAESQHQADVFFAAGAPGKPGLAALLRELLERASARLSRDEAHFAAHPIRSLVNGDLNPANWLVRQGTAQLVDWERAQITSPALDLTHLLNITTTTWRDEFAHVLSPAEEEFFLNAYVASYPLALRPVLRWQFQLMRLYTYLRAFSWCAYWRARCYLDQVTIREAATDHKISQYLEPAFMRATLQSYL